MGAMKVLATKDAEGAADKAEKAALKALAQQEYEASLNPIAGLRKVPEGNVLVLSWPSKVLKKFKKDGEMYFLCWSHQWTDGENFYPRVEFIALEQTYEYANLGKGDALSVEVSGPYDPGALDEQYLPMTPYEDLEQSARLAASMKHTVKQTGPTYLWHAKLI